MGVRLLIGASTTPAVDVARQRCCKGGLRLTSATTSVSGVRNGHGEAEAECALNAPAVLAGSGCRWWSVRAAPLVAVAVSAAMVAPAGYAGAVPLTGDLVLAGVPGYVSDVYPTGSKVGSALVGSDQPGCREALRRVVALVPQDADAYRGDIKGDGHGVGGRTGTVAFSVLVGLDSVQLGRAVIDGWATAIGACPEANLGPGQFGAHRASLRLNGVDAQVAEFLTVNEPGFVPKPNVFYYVAGVFGMMELVPTGDAAADAATLQQLAQAQVDRIIATSA